MMWVWGVVNAVLIMLVIYCNGRGWRGGWALGFAAQCWLILFGVLGGGPWTFVFSTGPAIMFAVNWWLHPRRVARRFAIDAAIVRAAVAASHEQPSPLLNVRLGLSGEEALANIDGFMRDFPVTRAPRRALPPPYSVDGWMRPTASGDLSFPVDSGQVDRVQGVFGPPLSDEETKAKLAEYMTRLMENPYTGLKESVDSEVATAKLLGLYPPPPQPGMSTDILPATGHLGGTPKDPPGGCLLCPGGADVPQTELIGHLISHHPEVYDGSPFETWPVDDTTSQEGDHE